MRLQFESTPDELRVWVAETKDILQALDAHLLRLECDGPSTALIDEMFRATHTIKGSAASVGNTRMASLTHAVEAVLDEVRNGRRELLPADIDRIFAALDVLRLLATEIESHEVVEVDVDAHIRVLAEDPESVERPRAPIRALRPSTLPRPPGSTHHLVVQFENGAWAAARALQTLLVLEELGIVLLSNPSRRDLEEGRVGERLERLEAWIQSAEGLDRLRDSVGSVAEVMLLGLNQLASEDEDSDENITATIGGSSEEEWAPRGAPSTVRINVERLDSLVDLVRQLDAGRIRLVGLGELIERDLGEHPLGGRMREAISYVSGVTDQLQTEIAKSRLQPIGPLFGRMARLVRDLAARQGKQVDLRVDGHDIVLDRRIIHGIGDPLIHLLRNAVDHGVELPARRVRRGKPPTATIWLRAQPENGFIDISVEDDGAGIDGAAVRARAVQRGHLSPVAAAQLSREETMRLIFTPGLSTSPDPSDVSGRGVGLDIVRVNVERLGGSVEVETQLGRGTRFVLHLPLELATL